MNTFANDTHKGLKQMMLYCAGASRELRDFTVGLSNEPDTEDYKICTEYNGRPRVMHDLSCSSLSYKERIARHVIVQVMGTSRQFCLCEVQVFGLTPGMIVLFYYDIISMQSFLLHISLLPWLDGLN